MPRETWEAVKRGLGIEIDKNMIEREAQAAQRVQEREEETSPKILRTYDNDKGVDLFNALRLAEHAGKTILSHSQWRRIVEDPELFKEYESALPAWTSTGIAYAAPGKELGNRINFGDLTVKIPKEYQKLKDVVLIFPNLKIERDSIVHYHVKTAEIDVVKRFPSKDGWYLPDPNYTIPQGAAGLGSNQSALYLRRINGPYVGAVVLGWSALSYQFRRDVYMDSESLSDVFGVVASSASTTSNQK